MRDGRPKEGLLQQVLQITQALIDLFPIGNLDHKNPGDLVLHLVQDAMVFSHLHPKHAVLRQLFHLLAGGRSGIFGEFLEFVQDVNLSLGGQLSDCALCPGRYPYLVGHGLLAAELLAQLGQADGAFALGLFDCDQSIMNV
jgi:hypothetical protein